MVLERCKHCQATDRAKVGDHCGKSPTKKHEWIAVTHVGGGSTPTPGGSKPFTTATGKK